jgi:hypothetical protein
LLETVYNDFDRIARMRKVFKVETVGDCYVAVAGLPDPRKVCSVHIRLRNRCLFLALIYSRISLKLVFCRRCLLQGSCLGYGSVCSGLSVFNPENDKET